MPFNSENASIYGAKGGRKSKTPGKIRNKQFTVKLTNDEYAAISNKAEESGMSKADLVVMAVMSFEADFHNIVHKRTAQWLKDNPDRKTPTVEIADADERE